MPTKARKTIELAELKDKVNYHLALKDDSVSTYESRLAMATLLESMLMRANAYKGFKYRAGAYDWTNPSEPVLREGYDETRRIYY